MTVAAAQIPEGFIRWRCVWSALAAFAAMVYAIMPRHLLLQRAVDPPDSPTASIFPYAARSRGTA